jgi:predicted nucleotidyltransferase
MNDASKTEILDPIISILKDDVEFALLFGSIKTGRILPKSDIDLAVYLKKHHIEFNEYIELKTRLSATTERDIDLVILNSCDIIIAMQVLANGELIVNNNHNLFVRYKAQKISEYIDFKMDRKAIEKNILAGGIYA